MKPVSFVITAQRKMSAPVNYTIEICKIEPTRCVEYEYKEKFLYLCKSGCQNYNKKWSCPPYSPTFSSVALKWKYLYVFYFRMPLFGFADINNSYLRVKAANIMLKSRADKYLRCMSQKHGKYISTGSCRLCNPCKCKEDKPCAHPNLMTYSFESLGIDVINLINKYFNDPLQWYKRKEPIEYTSVVCGLLTNEELNFDYLQEMYLSLIQN